MFIDLFYKKVYINIFDTMTNDRRIDDQQSGDGRSYPMYFDRMVIVYSRMTLK